jgi:hypothetical protein
MKKILLGLVAGLSLVAFSHIARAEGDAAGGDAGKTEAPAKKGKKGKKGKKAAEGEAGGEAGAGAGDATKK